MMGKSDPYLINFYMSFLEANKQYESVGFFGQEKENFLSTRIQSKERKFYDFALGNWNINAHPYNIKSKFDLIVCTRCAYFSKKPVDMINSFISMLKPGGSILIDWGLGDHWRFKNFKVGWVKEKEQEYAYTEDNFLWSCAWHNNFENHDQVKLFKESISRYGYKAKLKKIIDKEVPVVLDLKDIIGVNIKENHLFLWPDSPQLYSCLLISPNF
jgi:hypothetical protein